jgi:hypothetical protein
MVAVLGLAAQAERREMSRLAAAALGAPEAPVAVRRLVPEVQVDR